LTIGAGVGFAVAQWIIESGRGGLLPLGAALPAFGVAVLCALYHPSEPYETKRNVEESMDLLPIWSDQWPRLLRAVVVAVVVAGGFIAWPLPHVPSGISVQPAWLTAILLLSAGFGMLAEAFFRSARPRSVGAFGMTCVMVGMLNAILMIPVRWGGDVPTPVTVAATCVGVATVGFAAAYGYRALLASVALRASVGAVTLSRMLMAAVLTGWIGVPLIEFLVGNGAIAFAGATGLLAIGGILLIHEPLSPPRVHRVRLGALFGSVVVLFVLARFVSQ